jgi:signal transduction histidine kinase
MSSLIGYTDLLLSESVGILGALQRKFLERIKASTERMGGLIEDLAHVTALDSQQQALTPAPIDILSVIHEAVANTESQRRSKNISLELKLAEPMPELRADREALQQILANLLQNAGAASPAGGKVSLRARVENGEEENDFVFLQITDSGGGIQPDELPRLFSSLYHAETALLSGAGDTGISLAVVKSLIEAHGGRIWVDSEMGKGCTFSVVLPIVSSASDNGRSGLEI